MSADIDVFVICSVGDIERGSAMPFSLSRIHDNGEARPFPIVVVRTYANAFFGYVNSCPHEGVWLNFGSGEFFSADRAFLKCGRHGAMFEIDSGTCIDGPCKGQSLEPVAIAVIGSDVCLCGVKLVEDDRVPSPFDEHDETMEIMIHPD